MYTTETLKKEIKEIVEPLMNIGQVIDPDYVTDEILASHSTILKGDITDWASRYAVRIVVGKFIKNNIDYNQKYQEQYRITGQGFEEVPAYVGIKRNDKDLRIPLDKITEKEIIEKKNQMISKGRKEIKNANAYYNAWKAVQRAIKNMV